MSEFRRIDPLRFKSGNNTPVERAHLTATEYAEVLDLEDALEQAVDLAEYVEEHAKGKMSNAAGEFLSAPYGQFVRKRALAVQRLVDDVKRLRATQREYMDLRGDPEATPEAKEAKGKEVGYAATDVDNSLHALQLVSIY